MDVLSDVLQVVRLAGAVFFTAELSAPWSVASPPSARLAPLLMPKAACLSLFHVVAEGNCWVETDGSRPLALAAGDVIIFPHGDAHALSSEIGIAPVPIGQILPRPPKGEMPRLIHGGGGPITRFVCGFLHCDQRFNPLFAALPTLICLRSRPGSVAVEASGHEQIDRRAVPAEERAWLETSLRYLIAEADRANPGNRAMLSRLTELIFVEVLRGYMQALPPARAGWLSALNDPHVANALRLMHAEPARDWTVEELARTVGMSRSGLAQRFVDLLHESPKRYLATWRTQIAMQLLHEQATNIAEVAARVGYESEAAFSRAFKRQTGISPAAWRNAAGNRQQFGMTVG